MKVPKDLKIKGRPTGISKKDKLKPNSQYKIGDTLEEQGTGIEMKN